MSFVERKKDPSVEAAEDKSVQDWDLKDVIFVEDKRNIPVGKVLKVSVSSFFLEGRSVVYGNIPAYSISVHMNSQQNGVTFVLELLIPLI